MYRYFEPKDKDFFLLKDSTYCDILRKLDGFDIKDKLLFIKMISDCYHRFHKSIQAKSDNDIELFISLIMVLLINQGKEIERLTM